MLTNDILWAGLTLILVAAVLLWLLLRWQRGLFLRRLNEDHRLSNEKLDATLNALKASVQTSLDAEAMTNRLVTGIAESLIPTLQHLNVDVKELNVLLSEMRDTTQQSAAISSELIARAEQNSRHFADAIEELIILRRLAEDVVVEQSNRLRTIDIALDFLSSRVQGLGHVPAATLPVEVPVDPTKVGEAPLEDPSEESKGDLDHPDEGESEIEAPRPPEDDSGGEESTNPDKGASIMNWRNHQWAVTDAGMEALGEITCPIAKERLAELRHDKAGIAEWPMQVADKTWVDFDAFFEAFTKALEIHRPKGFEAIDLAETERQALIRAERTTRQPS